MYTIKNKYRQTALLILLLVCSISAFAQLICEETKQKIKLSNNTIVYAYKAKGNAKLVYYVTTEFRLATSKGKPEFLFQKYKRKGIENAIMHLFITWELSKKHKKELKIKVKKLFGEKIRIGGAIDLKSITEQITFNQKNPIGKILKQTLKSKGFPPTIASSKMALAFRISGKQVKQLEKALKNAKKLNQVTLSLPYTYNTVACSKGYKKTKKNKIVITGYLKKWF